MPVPRHVRCSAVAAFSALLAANAIAEGSAAVEVQPWHVVGRQGLLQVVIVPAGQAAERAAYEAQLARLCPAGQTCFVNFFTNASGAAVELPLPDAVAAQATARFRRSAKNGVEVFQWSCRVSKGSEDCF